MTTKAIAAGRKPAAIKTGAVEASKTFTHYTITQHKSCLCALFCGGTQ
jgi:hypothetical protein